MKKDGRLHLRLPEDLKQEVQEYATRHHTDLSTLVIRFFTQLVEEDRRRRAREADAEQV